MNTIMREKQNADYRDWLDSAACMFSLKLPGLSRHFVYATLRMFHLVLLGPQKN